MARILVEREERLRKGSISREILHILSERVVALPAYKGAEINSFFLPRLETFGIGRRRRNSIRVAIDRLRRQRCIELRRDDAKNILAITDRGKIRLNQYAVESLSLTDAPRWDRLWRIAMFDIPEQHKRARDAISQKLSSLGFYKLQRSVFVHHAPCANEIRFLGDFFGVGEHLTLVEAKSLGVQERRVRQFFELI